MTYTNFSDYLKRQLQRNITREEFSEFILNQRLMKIGNQSDMNSNFTFFYENAANVLLNEDNTISGDKLAFRTCIRNLMYFSILQHKAVATEMLLLKAELDKAMVSDNPVLLIKRVSLVHATELTTNSSAPVLKEKALVKH